MQKPFSILLSSAGRRVALLRILRRTLSDLGLEGHVVAVDTSPLAAAFQLADRAFVLPRCTSTDFIPAVLGICRANDIRLVVPTIDTELPIYAAARQEFAAEGIVVAVSTPEVVEIGADKVRTHEWLVANEFPAVRQALPEAVLAHPEEWPFPLMAKPRRGSSSVGAGVVRSPTQLREVAGTGGFVVETIAPGDEYTIDIVADRAGGCLCAVPRRRLEVRGGEVSKGMTVRSDRMEVLAGDICASLPGAYGALNLQAFHDDATGDVRVIELNPRFGGGFPLAWEAGAKFPQWTIEEILGFPVTACSRSWRDGIVMLRYDEAVFVRSEGLPG